MAYVSIPHRLLVHAARQPDHPAYFVKEGGEWKGTSWAEYADQVRQAGKAMIALGLEPGGTVCILGFTRPERVIFDLGCLSAAGVPAGIYTTNSAEECRYIINHAEASLLLLEGRKQWEKIASVRRELPSLKKIVMMKGASKVDDPMVLDWEAFLAEGEKVPDGDLDERMGLLAPERLAKLIYTSGTTGPPKGVMLSHANIVWVGETLRDLCDWNPNDRTLSFLPLSHIAEQNMSIHGAVTAGSMVYFAESMQALPQNLQEVQPTLFLAVPRVWEKLYDAVRAKLDEVSGLQALLLRWARSVGTRVSRLKMVGKRPVGPLALEYRLAKRLVLDKVKAAIGMRELKMGVSGAAPIAMEVLEYLASLDVLINEVYGLSETTGGITFNRAGKVRLGSVGTPLPGVEERIVQAVRKANEKFSRVEQIKRIYLLDRDLSIEDGEITPTMKVKRRRVEKKFAEIFDRLYEDESFGITVMEKEG